jgi:membrane peptidoglycan carboxypeptidase
LSSNRNFDETFRGPTQLKQALAQSINVPSVKVLYLAGLQDTIDIATKMGITTLNDISRYGLSLVLGGGEVKLTDIVNAYSVFAQDGIKHDQSFILKLEDSSGNVIEEYKDNAVQVIEPQYVRMINQILSDSNLRSGLLQSSLYLTMFDGYEVALKTGTTNDYRDAWVIGYTPFLTVGVWAGNSNYKPMEKQGGSILAAVPIWSSFLKEVINNFKPETFISPDPVSSTKPMLNGLFVTNTGTYQTPNFQLHSILYYIDKNDLQKEFSKDNPNPGQDPQFINWEVPVIEWARNNIPNFSTLYNK